MFYWLIKRFWTYYRNQIRLRLNVNSILSKYKYCFRKHGLQQFLVVMEKYMTLFWREKTACNLLTDVSKLRNGHQRCSVRKEVLRNFAKFIGKHLRQASDLQLYLKRDSGTGVFEWVLRNFYEHLFYRTPLGDCFWKPSKCLPITYSG